MLTPGLSRNQRQPRRQARHVHALGVTGPAKFGLDPERARIQIGMPKDPSRERIPDRVFSESEAPISRVRSVRRRSSGWPGIASPHSRDRGEATPT